MSKKITENERIAELETELRRRDEKIKELRQEITEARDLVDQMVELTEEHDALIDQWIEVFDMKQGEDGAWHFDSDFTDAWEENAESSRESGELLRENLRLITEWNAAVGDFNAVVHPRDRGRPLAASEQQVEEVRKLGEEGKSRRFIAERTGLGERTVRTIIEQKQGKDRTSIKRKYERKKMFDRLRAAEYRRKLKLRAASCRAKIKACKEHLPNRVNAVKKGNAELLKAARGLGQR